MRTLFTIHAGEFLVGQEIEKKKKGIFRGCKLWIPVKDDGIDFVITDEKCNKRVSIQVKFSIDYRVKENENRYLKGNKIISASWFSLQYKKIKDSKADKWVLVCFDAIRESTHYLIIDPKILCSRYKSLKRKKSGTIKSYFWVNDKNECWETRDLKSDQKQAVCNAEFKDKSRNFTKFLNNWKALLD